jgi:Domain of unknown function (DUF397)
MPAPDLSRAAWRKSSYSNGSGGSCVEIAALTPAAGEHDIAVRDSKDPHGPALTFTARQWSAFTTAIKAHEFDLA